MKYSELIFDLYGTLVDIRTRETEAVWDRTALYFGYYGARYSGSELRGEFLRLLREREAAAGQDYECFPDVSVEGIMEELFTCKGIRENVSALALNAAQLFRVCSTEYIRLYPGVLEALEFLRSKGCRLWLLSNAQRVFTEYELRALGLLGKFDGVYISSDFGFRKPDTRFFKALIEAEGIDKSQALMIGNDRQTDIAGAKKAGLATLYMHTNITPPGQSPASPALFPGILDEDIREYEYEGSDWDELKEIVVGL